MLFELLLRQFQHLNEIAAIKGCKAAKSWPPNHPTWPTGETEIALEGLGTAKGLVYRSGVRQFNGVPYGRIAKRWARATLAESWPNNCHDGTKLGYVLNVFFREESLSI
jgi:hypothetical protein